MTSQRMGGVPCVMRKSTRLIGVAALCVVLAVGLIVLISTHLSSGTLITAGPSRKSCLYTGGTLQPGLSNAEAQTGTPPSCVMAFTNSAQTWAQWTNPRVTV